MSLSWGFDQSFPPWAKDETAVELQLAAQLLDELLVLLDGLRMALCGLIDRGLKVLNLLSMEFRGLIECGLEIVNLLS